MLHTATNSPARVLVVSEIFPPAVGGSGELMRNVYTRFGDVPVTVLTHGDSRETTRDGDHVTVIRAPMRAEHWGLVHPTGLGHHLGRAAAHARLNKDGPVVTHCSAVLPEGLDARLAQLLHAGPYVCWAHGEELAIAGGSRELTWLARRVFRNASAVIANTAHTASMVSLLGVSRQRLHVVHPGVDADRFTPEADRDRGLRRQLSLNGEAILLTVGRLQRRKGHDLTIDALARWPADAPPVRYVIVGDGAERGLLEQQARDRGVGDRVCFVGAVPTHELPAYYAAADLFVHPNRVDGSDFEGFGMVFLEAAAAGLAVVGGRTGGVPEAVVDGETGVLVSGTSVEELASVLVALVADSPRRLALGAAGCARARRDFTWERAAGAVREVHREVATREFGGRQ